MLKRIFDICAALAGLATCSPIFFMVALVIKREDGGPILYPGVRTGRHGRPFRMFKFRTMVMNADQIGGSSTADDDPRITKIGSKLRKYKLDELPQLLNVLKGDMSIVGPRPEVPYYTDKFDSNEKKILSVRPGITDWATLWNPDEGAILKGAEDPDRAYEELIQPTKIKLQLKYVREQSFGSDIKIILKTLKAIVT
ncbi:sugar transferase [Thermodesulfobacteriota bacterium]